jgi:hypothetical protein
MRTGATRMAEPTGLVDGARRRRKAGNFAGDADKIGVEHMRNDAKWGRRRK